MGVNEQVRRTKKMRDATGARKLRVLNPKRLDRRGRTRRLPPDIAAAVGRQVVKAQARSIDEALTEAKRDASGALDDFYIAVKERDAARLEAVQALWSNWRLALDRHFLEGALKLMHPAEIRPFVPDAEAESFRLLIGEVWSGAAETRSDGQNP